MTKNNKGPELLLLRQRAQEAIQAHRSHVLGGRGGLRDPMSFLDEQDKTDVRRYVSESPGRPLFNDVIELRARGEI